MNDNDLERRLRSESGPREEGYRAVPLPDAPGEQPGRPHPNRLLRAGLVIATVGAGVLAVAAASALLTPGQPNQGVGEGATLTPSPSPSASPSAPADCQPVDLALTAEPWGGAAGSRGTVVTVSLADGRYPCIVQRNVAATIRDADGTALVSAVVDMIYDPVVLDPGDEYTVGVAWSNWCDGSAAEPVTLVLSSGAVEFPLDVPAGADPVPPCMGENAESTLSVTQLQPAD